ncbi:armadillo-type protein [Lipomyces japonicus]|uniref:armadillo-type protein n=1 Tax=Lipomyces japonicus TaxID=56871 RepID=UPI0034CE05AF
MSWQPQQDQLQQLRTVFSQTLSSDNNTRAAATKTLEDARRSQVELNNYLVYLFVNPTTDAEVHLRASAGLMLKNNLLTRWDEIHNHPTILNYIKDQIVLGLTQPFNIVRNISGSAISALVARGGFKEWPEVLPKLMAMAEHENSVVQEGALSALSKLFEDSGALLDADPDGQAALGFMMPRFLELARSSSSAKVRGQSIVCLNQFILRGSQSLFMHIDLFLNTLFGLALDSDADVRRNVCTAFVMLLDVREDKLVPHLNGIVDYTLHCMVDEDEQVALEACEFIFGLTESTRLQPQVEQLLGKIVPVLLRTMVYSETEVFILDSVNDDDADMEDKLTDIKPTHARSKSAHHVSNSNRQEDGKRAQGNDDDDDDNDNDDEDDDDDDDDDDSGLDMSEWTLRKCSASALDMLSAQFKHEILDFALPVLKDNLQSPQWPVREATILAYGAISEGCVDGLGPFLPAAIPYFVQELSDPVAPVRQISCWTLGRYSSWICYRSADVGYEQEFIPVLQGLLKCCLDNNKKVQEAGCSGFANFTEQAGGLIIPYLTHVLRNLTLCFQRYQSRNLTILYDAVQTLVDKVGYAMGNKEYIDLLLPPLIDRWQKLQDDDTDLFPLLECLSSVTAALGEHFAPFALPVFHRASSILQRTLIRIQESSIDPLVEMPDKDFIVTTLDLLDGLVQGLGNYAAEMISQSEFPIMEMIIHCTRDEVNEVRQSAFALLGDMTIYTFSIVKPYVPTLMTEIIPQVDGSDLACSPVCNNATWASGELALKLGQEMRPFVDPLIPKLIALLTTSPFIDQSITENAAITIGRLGISNADLIAPSLQTFAASWCQALRLIQDTGEKESAFQGMCQIVMANPAGLNESLILFVEAIGLYADPTPELAQMFMTLLTGYKGYVNDWDSAVASKLAPEIRLFLEERYGV